MTWFESDALVLRHVKQGDTSHVVTLFARDSGKVAVLAKGSRKPGSRFGAGLDLFNLSRIRYRARPHGQLVFLDACELRTSFDRLSHDVFTYAAAGVCAELVDRIVPDGASSTEIFDLLLEAISALAETSPLPGGEELRAVALPVAFEMKLMDSLGIAPELTGCVACGNADLGGSSSLSARRGGLLCRRCRAAEGGRRLGPETVDFLRASLFGSVSAPLSGARAPGPGAILESRAALEAVLEYHHGGRPALRSLRFLDELWR
ncbi:MAG: DNA repair protein RecO [Candidatus Eiseniibacteriota bacterium]